MQGNNKEENSEANEDSSDAPEGDGANPQSMDQTEENGVAIKEEISTDDPMTPQAP